MKRTDILDTSSLFVDLARDLDSSLTSETGKTLNIVEFIEQEVDLGIALTRNQLLPLKICYGCELDPEDLAVIDYWRAAGKTTMLEDRKAPPQVMVLESGRRSGKSTLAALIAAYEFYFMSKLDNPQKHYKVATSTPIGILCLATTAEQARRNIFRQILQILRNSEYFIQLERKKEIFLGKEEIAYEAKGLYIQSGNSKSASQVGSTLKCFILDEASRFQDSEGSSNALQLWSNIGISAAPFGSEAKLIAISSAWYEGDAIQKLYESTQHDEYAVGFKLVSWDLNTTINKENPIVAHEYAENPDKAALEYEGVRPAAVDAFLDPQQIRRAMIGNSAIQATSFISTETEVNLVKLTIDSIERRQISDSILHIDPAIKGDNYALALGHSEFNEYNEQIVVIDSILVWHPSIKQEVSISNVGEIIRAINAHRPLSKVTADHYNSAETIQRLRQDGIRAEIVYFSNRQQLMMYTRLKTLLAEGKLILPKDSPWSELLYTELSHVQLINNRKIDHPEGYSKDIADAIASVAYELSERVLLDNVKDLSNIGLYSYGNLPDYSQMNNRQKALTKLHQRRQWAVDELKYLSENKYKSNNEGVNKKYPPYI